ncbi:hypothetical protein EYF80_021043 [Liparis tanakae]|uniref:Uncharacterized protein n=1 Tax=Liparis tanakae TaxID=230148 RepID=A0A4Z2HT61_9TELE|nr:hypothetical protein EYF80_021043 [Liparis tanakae]
MVRYVQALSSDQLHVMSLQGRLDCVMLDAADRSLTADLRGASGRSSSRRWYPRLDTGRKAKMNRNIRRAQLTGFLVKWKQVQDCCRDWFHRRKEGRIPVRSGDVNVKRQDSVRRRNPAARSLGFEYT